LRLLRKARPALLDWFAANARDLPWRRTRDPYAIWVSEIMLQQTQVKTVIPYWERWMRELPTIEAAAKASPAKIHKLWEGLGYYTRVRNLQKGAKRGKSRSSTAQKHGGRFPGKFETCSRCRASGVTPPARFAASPSTSRRRFSTATSSAC
jgi:A/G-specific adenine glycosylase